MANITTISRKGLKGILKQMFEEHSESGSSHKQKERLVGIIHI